MGHQAKEEPGPDEGFFVLVLTVVTDYGIGEDITLRSARIIITTAEEDVDCDVKLCRRRVSRRVLRVHTARTEYSNL